MTQMYLSFIHHLSYMFGPVDIFQSSFLVIILKCYRKLENMLCIQWYIYF